MLSLQHTPQGMGEAALDKEPHVLWMCRQHSANRGTAEPATVR